ncbi:MAG: winged helix-turn-helix transcriptional regulator [Acidimicrobiales bacterium]|nr:winged helix-turn-helix transcriptional regulator [Acidimicrobiales bacterium]HRW39709.1 metalloregulator ArsR/SmtB family transcription factor [Aquihabitans sp.]
MTDGIDRGMQALAHAGRRRMLRLVSTGERTSSELAEATDLSRSAASQHLKVLRDAGLVHVRVDANRRLYSADLAALAILREELDAYWADHLDALKRTAEDEQRRRAGGRRPRQAAG